MRNFADDFFSYTPDKTAVNMNRFAIQDLIKWKDSARRKPLIIEGARQVGKTWLVMDFAAKHYKSLAYINFENQKNLRDIFADNFNIERILQTISIATGKIISPGETLIFLDEIQEADNGVTALKYFSENAPEHHVIAAGSLLGISLHKHTSFPVGKVQFLTLRPMSFFEFLDAIGEEMLRKAIEAKNIDIANSFASKLTELLKKYYYIGGMPEAVLSYVQRQDSKEVRAIQQDILRSYDLDFSKHAPTEIVPRIRQLWNSIPTQLSRENRKFIFGLIKEGARAREYEVALQWLIDAGLIYKVSNVTAPRIPLKAYEDPKAFKIYALDLGLLGAMTELDEKTIIDGNRIFVEFKGALTEQYVLQELILHHAPYYFSKSNSKLEIDFLIQMNGEIVPLEVKAEENLKAKSLSQFVADNHSPEAYRLSMSSYRRESWMTNIPLYAAETI